MRDIDGRSYHAARGFLPLLVEELGERERIDGELITCLGRPRAAYWTRNIWEKPFIAEFDSVSQAARLLKNIQRNWAALPSRLHRRSALISQALPGLPSKPRRFPFEVPDVPMGAFSLIDEHSMIASAICSSPFPNGEFEFEEDHLGPPSRAYRKLWESLCLAGRIPKAGERCIDAGASPGGWTWALAKLGAEVLAVDKAHLDPEVAAMRGVRFMRRDAFGLLPEEAGPVDWLCCDVICYPEALFAWVSRWLEAKAARNYICTIKMQGPGFDRAVTERFAAIPDSRVLHLWHNRHELTWIKVEADRGLGSPRLRTIAQKADDFGDRG